MDGTPHSQRMSGPASASGHAQHPKSLLDEDCSGTTAPEHFSRMRLNDMLSTSHVRSCKPTEWRGWT